MIKVVEAISDRNIGGAGILLLNRLSNADKNRFDITVMLPDKSLLKKRIEALGIKTVEIKGGDSSLGFIEVVRFAVALKKINPHLINSHGSLSSRIAATAVGVPVRIYTRHCVYPVGKVYDYDVVRCAVRAVTNILSHRVIAVAHAAKEDLIKMGVDSKKISVIINGARQLRMPDEKTRKELKKRFKISDDDTVITICARLEACKDHECLLRAAEILNKKGIKFKLFIIGTGSLNTELKRLVRELHLDGNVIFTGFVEDVSPYLGITDINVNCSVGTETSSLALSEGMGLGIPSVVSDYGGNPYMVRHGQNGYVYEKGDPEDLARWIVKMINDKKNGEYARMSKESKKRFERELNAKQMTAKTEDLYVSMIKEKTDA